MSDENKQDNINLLLVNAVSGGIKPKAAQKSMTYEKLTLRALESCVKFSGGLSDTIDVNTWAEKIAWTLKNSAAKGFDAASLVESRLSSPAENWFIETIKDLGDTIESERPQFFLNLVIEKFKDLNLKTKRLSKLMNLRITSGESGHIFERTSLELPEEYISRQCLLEIFVSKVPSFIRDHLLTNPPSGFGLSF
ncbi:uncharacterized protein NDAI_0E04940 [Naumovozyma dairenensis CBS 421]|uniref:Uncharacterized protein n=1 Tax=Naumovozyma dairenensis (strain ATCC 10597 / BCRC 20456 / CBS 421 / NBRC 0211 / NRRL Y-12639) TaxID=1071378 RepID=G0WAN8_NAUDC|nr:hypothetical protein NDAI_0E04940 [Naumovozyma dairenensis CBS 421]CCD25311.1 hypothetical protein NDAI_0E04940 [Naumovozyma dairenensis CBS 421]